MVKVANISISLSLLTLGIIDQRYNKWWVINNGNRRLHFSPWQIFKTRTEIKDEQFKSNQTKHWFIILTRKTSSKTSLSNSRRWSKYYKNDWAICNTKKRGGMLFYEECFKVLRFVNNILNENSSIACIPCPKIMAGCKLEYNI